MIEEINIEQTSERQTVAASTTMQEDASTARTSADRKPMVSWADLLDEAVKKPGFIHEAYSRFYNYCIRPANPGDVG